MVSLKRSFNWKFTWLDGYFGGKVDFLWVAKLALFNVGIGFSNLFKRFLFFNLYTYILKVFYTYYRWRSGLPMFRVYEGDPAYSQVFINSKGSKWSWYFPRIIWFTVDCTAFVHNFLMKPLKDKVSLNQLIYLFTLY